jgi:HEPN domain-containing protein
VALPRFKPVFIALGCLVLAWVLAVGGYFLVQNSRVTAEKVRAYLHSVDLAKLSGPERARVLRELARELNALSLDERREVRLDDAWSRWFAEMTDDEKGQFIAATMPTGIKQMLASFEQMPEAQRRKTIDDALKRLKEARERAESGVEDPANQGANGPPVLSDELRQKITAVGLNAYYSQSSAQMKAELAPLLEEMQRMMERGVFLRRQ